MTPLKADVAGSVKKKLVYVMNEVDPFWNAAAAHVRVRDFGTLFRARLIRLGELGSARVAKDA